MAEFLLASDIEEICRRIAEPAKQLAGKTVLLTGARGFLGRYSRATQTKGNQYPFQ